MLQTGRVAGCKCPVQFVSLLSYRTRERQACETTRLCALCLNLWSIGWFSRNLAWTLCHWRPPQHGNNNTGDAWISEVGATLTPLNIIDVGSL